jgi:tetratricopeptide (TPR) repeat protein
MKRLVGSIVTLFVLVTPLAMAQESAEDKQKAKDARVEEYLRNKEQRRLEKDARHQEKVERRDAEAKTAAAAATTAELKGDRLPRELVRAQDAVRASTIGSDPTIQRYLDLIEQQAASPSQLAAFGNFVAEAGMTPEAEVYYNVALSLEQEDTTLWLNYGTLMRQLGELSKAASAYGHALELSPSNALAHYNLGTVLDAQGKYEDAIDAYTVALMMDPSLGDPKVNPSATNNQRLVAVKLMLYQQQTGSLGMPMIDIPDGGLPDDAGRSDRTPNN